MIHDLFLTYSMFSKDIISTKMSPTSLRFDMGISYIKETYSVFVLLVTLNNIFPKEI